MNLGNRFSQHSFAQIPSVNTPRSKFDRSFAAKDTMYFDQLTPVFIDEVLPGDTINLNLKMFARLAPQVKPLMDNMHMDFFFFYVPNRIVWENWEKFNGARENPNDSTDYLIPILNSGTGGFPSESMADHFGIPANIGGAGGIKVNALPFRAYNLIWNEWFRDQNLQTRAFQTKGDAADGISNYPLRKRAKKHDYFTSALPWPQKGSAIELPLGSMAPIVSNGTNPTFTVPGSPTTQRSLGASFNGSNNIVNISGATVGGTTTPMRFGDQTGLQADLSSATATTINQLRQAMMMQSILELDARGGTRYVEILKAHFNVVSPDFRLQRPEYLSGGTIQINQHPVAQTSETATTPQANLAAFSTAHAGGNKIGFSKSFVEHGYVIGLAQARGDVTYQQGLNKLWSRETRWDFFWPKLQELGEQAIFNQEIYLQSAATPANKEIFGYAERYAEYRFRPSEIRGQFRSTFAQSLDVWHLAEEFGSPPALNSTFIESNTPIERALVVTEGYPHLLCDMWFDYKHARPMITYGVPATLGRF